MGKLVPTRLMIQSRCEYQYNNWSVQIHKSREGQAYATKAGYARFTQMIHKPRKSTFLETPTSS